MGSTSEDVVSDENERNRPKKILICIIIYFCFYSMKSSIFSDFIPHESVGSWLYDRWIMNKCVPTESRKNGTHTFSIFHETSNWIKSKSKREREKTTFFSWSTRSSLSTKLTRCKRWCKCKCKLKLRARLHKALSVCCCYAQSRLMFFVVLSLDHFERICSETLKGCITQIASIKCIRNS